MFKKSLYVLTVFALLAGCINIKTQPYQKVDTPLLDPAANVIPMPNDLLMSPDLDPNSGKHLLQVPAESFSDTGKEYFDNYINKQDGWSVDSTLTTLFSTADIDPATINEDTVQVYDITDFLANGASPEKLSNYKLMLDKTANPVTGEEIARLTIIPAKNLAADHRYAVMLTHDIKTLNNNNLDSSFSFNLLKARKPLIDEAGEVTVLRGQVSKSDAAMLEPVRKLNDSLLSHFEKVSDNFSRKNIVLFWTFKTFSKAVAVFNPVTSDVPTPNDIARNEQGKFDIPDTLPPVQKDLFKFFNTLDGFSVISTPTVKFSQPLDPSTLDENSYIVLDITDQSAPLKVDTINPVIDNSGNLVLVNSVAFEKGHHYLCAVKNNLKALNNNNKQVEIIPAPAMYFFFLDNPIIKDGKNQLAGIVDDATAQLLNKIKTGYSALIPLLDVYGFKKDNLLSIFTFTTTIDDENLVDPNQSIVPLPNDLLITNGKLGLPLPAKPTDIEKSFVSWMNTLDGFPCDMTGGTSFSAPLDPASLNDSIKMYAMSPDGTSFDEWPGLLIQYKPDSTELGINTSGYYLPGYKYFVAITDSLKDKSGKPVDSSSFMALIKSKNSLFDDNGNNVIPTIVDDETAQLIESIRKKYAPILDKFEAEGLTRDHIIAFYSFSVQTDNEALYSPNTGVIPFPNDVLLAFDENMNVTGVNLPVPDNAPDSLKELYSGLSKFKGFSTLAPTYTGFSLPLDKTSFIPFSGSGPALPAYVSEFSKINIGVADVTDVDPAKPDTVMNLAVLGKDLIDIDFQGDRLLISPKPGFPLDQNRRYLFTVTSSIKSQGGEPIEPSPVFFMAKSEYPLADKDGKSMLYSIGDADAAQLEMLRTNYKPIFDAFNNLGIERKNILLFWTITTQSITKTLEEVYAQLKQEPTSDVTGGKVYKITSKPPAELFNIPDDNPYETSGVYTFTHIDRYVYNAQFNTKMLLSDPDLSDPANPKLGKFKAKGENGKYPLSDVPINFIMTIPNNTLSPMPLVIFQHGIGGSKADLWRIADLLAEHGFAAIAIDAVYHGDRKLGDEKDGEYFITADLFATRDNFRQSAIDLMELKKVIDDDKLNKYLGSKGLSDLTIDKNNVFYIGSSLGGMIGSLFAAIDDNLQGAVLVSPPSHFSVFADQTQAEWMKNIVSGVLEQLGMQKGTPEYLQFLGTVQWILDAADPLNYIKYITRKPLGDNQTTPLLLIEPELDTLVPMSVYNELAIAASGDAADKGKYAKTYAHACHAFLLHKCVDNESEELKQDRLDAFNDIISFINFNLTSTGGAQ